MQAEDVKQSFVVFDVGGRPCALPLDQIQEVLPMATLAKPPGLPRVLEGFLDLAGHAIPVLRADRLLGLPEQPLGLYTHILLFRQDGVIHGLVVDRVHTLLRVDADQMRTVDRKDLFNGCCIAEISESGSMVHLLSAPSLLFEKEEAVIQEHSTREQRRLSGLDDPQEKNRS
jgi:purine-binding chemotaxis protein CheW